MPSRRSAVWTAVVIVAVTAVLALLALRGGLRTEHRRHPYAGGVTTTATVLALHGVGRHEQYDVAVDVPGGQQTTVDDVAYSGSGLAKGQQVDVSYPVGQVDRARVVSRSDRYLVDLVGAGALLLIGLLAGGAILVNGLRQTPS